MPIPTDTFWNIRRLNFVFAISSVLLLGITGWSVIQDWNRDWRNPQKAGRVWEAAFTEDRIQKQLDEETLQQREQLTKLIADKEAEILERDQSFKTLERQIQARESDSATTEFKLSDIKATAAVMEAQLQHAIAANQTQQVQRLERQLVEPRERIHELSEQLAGINEELANLREDRKLRTSELDELRRQRTQLVGDIELLEKRLSTLQPGGLARLSSEARGAPLLQFVNPTERVRQVVLDEVQADMVYMKVKQIDRCMTCHVNIADKNFSEERVLAYLEERVAAAQQLRLPREQARPTDPAAIASAPGAVAMPGFWHHWAVTLAPDLVEQQTRRMRSLFTTVGKTTTVTVDGHQLSAFAYDPALNTAPPSPATQPDPKQPWMDRELQNRIFVELMRAWYRFVPGQGATAESPDGRIVVLIAETVDEKTALPLRNAALRYPADVRSELMPKLDKSVRDQLLDRYRFAMVELANAARREARLPPLDPSPVLLAHPRLDLYVAQDSAHPMDMEGDRPGVGCTSCHDGSGQETDFVLTAHVARNIYVDAKTGQPVLPEQLAQRPPAHHDNADLASMLHAVFPEGATVPTPAAALHFPAGEPDHAEGHRAHDAPAAVDFVDPVTGRAGKALTQHQYWVRTYEPLAPRSFKLVYHEWDRPMHPPQFIEANCVRCHTDIYDIKQEAPVIYEGRYLFTNLGCANCHQMDSIPEDENRKVGTDLRHVTTKLSPEFINSWIWSPKAFRPSTKMPHFFMLENNSSDEEIRRTRQEARAITEYLVQTATPMSPQFPMPQGLKGSPEAGRQLFNALGCMGCHVNLNDATGAQRGGKPVSVAEKWIVNDLVKRGELAREIEAAGGKVPAEKEVRAEAEKRFDAMSYNERQLYVLEKLEQIPGQKDTFRYPDGTARTSIFMHHGPELSGIGTKLTAGRTPEQARQWLFEWLKDPSHYADYTLMPRLRLSDQEAIDLAEYLLDQTRTKLSPDDQWQAQLAEVDTPKLIELTSLFLRSRFSIERSIERADDEQTLNEVAADALVTADRPLDQAKQMAAAMSKDQKRLVYLGKKLIGHYGCMSCHAINGTENLTSPCTNLSDWGQKGIDKLDFGYLTHHHVESLPPTRDVPMVNAISVEAANLAGGKLDWSQPIAHPFSATWPVVEHNRRDWLAHKLKNTRVFDRGRALLEPQRQLDENGRPVIRDGYPVLADSGKPYDKIKMPTFYLNDQQVHAIVTFVISNRDRLVREAIVGRATDDLARQIAHGRELTIRFNCVSCHEIEGNVPQVQQYYTREQLTDIAPPSLRGEGNKVNHGWLYGFFKHVEPLRPLMLDGIRMPSFPATDEQWTAIIAYFNSVSNKESAELQRLLAPVIKYIDEKNAASTQPVEADAVRPGDDWYAQAEFALAAERLRRWSLENKQMTELQFDPRRNKPEELARSYRTALFKAQFVIDLYRSPYPFTESPRVDMSPQRYELGREFFHQLQCLSCHHLGDPSAPGAIAQPQAPNLSLTAERLQRRWTRRWVQEPPIIQAGTKMPQFFSGLAAFDLHGQAWSAAQGRPQNEIDFYNSRYGATADDQANLLLDFLYAAGIRNFTDVQPPVETLPSPDRPQGGPSPAATAATATQPARAGSAAVPSPADPATPGNVPPDPVPSPPPSRPEEAMKQLEPRPLPDPTAQEPAQTQPAVPAPPQSTTGPTTAAPSP